MKCIRSYVKAERSALKELCRRRKTVDIDVPVTSRNCDAKFKQPIKGATKPYFRRYSYVVTILFNTGLCRSAFSTVSFGKLVFRLSVLSVFFCFESNVLNQDIKICVIMLSIFAM